MQKMMWILWVMGLSISTSFGQTKAVISSKKSDQLLIEWTRLNVDKKTNTVEISFRLTNLFPESRELKLNFFGSQLVDQKGEAHLFSTIRLGRVNVLLSDRQNYMHYLLPPDSPVEGKMQLVGYKGDTKNSTWKIVFEDRVEPGRFIEVELPGPSKSN